MQDALLLESFFTGRENYISLFCIYLFVVLFPLCGGALYPTPERKKKKMF